jgi:transposase InsO family protein
MSLQGSLSIERMCELARVSRASFYRSFQEQRPIEEEMEVRSAIQQIAVEHRRRYGYRRISAELRRRGMRVNHKRVMRIMAEDNLLAVRTRAFVVTTNSGFGSASHSGLQTRCGPSSRSARSCSLVRPVKRHSVFLASRFSELQKF